MPLFINGLPDGGKLARKAGIKKAGRFTDQAKGAVLPGKVESLDF